MLPEDLGKSVQESLKSVFHWGSRFHAEKIGIIAGIVVLSLISALWAFSEPRDGNDLGADVELADRMVGFELVVQNTGDQDWRDVRITLDRQYLFTTELIEAGDYVGITGSDTTYSYYIPRPWGQEGWENLTSTEKPGLHPDDDFEPGFVQIRTREGQYDLELE